MICSGAVRIRLVTESILLMRMTVGRLSVFIFTAALTKIESRSNGGAGLCRMEGSNGANIQSPKTGMV